jgi:hypothetical protein
VAGEDPDLTAVQDFDASNAAFIAAWRGRTMDEVLAELQAARAAWTAWLAGLAEEEFYRPRSYGAYDWTFATIPLQVQWQHDVEHAEQIAAWRKAAGLKDKTGPKAVLLAAMGAAREELLAAAAFVPAEERSSRSVCGAWTLKDLLGHVADWEWFGVAGLRHMAAGRPPQGKLLEDVETWNRIHVEARRDEPWQAVWDNLHAARQALSEVLAGMSEADLTLRFPFPWGARGAPYQWMRVYFDHDREHAQGLRGEEVER